MGDEGLRFEAQRIFPHKSRWMTNAKAQGIMPVSKTTDKHLCAFILSPFLPSGLKSYKKKNHLEFPETSKQISNRLEYLKKLRRDRFTKFADICNQHGVGSNPIHKEASSGSNRHNHSTDYRSDDPQHSAVSYVTIEEDEAPTASRAIRPISCTFRIIHSEATSDLSFRINTNSKLSITMHRR